MAILKEAENKTCDLRAVLFFYELLVFLCASPLSCLCSCGECTNVQFEACAWWGVWQLHPQEDKRRWGI